MTTLRSLAVLVVLAGCGGAPPAPTALRSESPAPHAAPPPIAVAPAAPRVEHIALGTSQGCALRADGRVWCWPLDADPIATPVPGLDDAVELEMSYEVSCARRRSGRVTCWGETQNGHRGAGHGIASGPTEVEGIADAIDVVTDIGGACVLRAGGTVECWGETLHSRRAVDHPEPIALPVPIARLEHTTGYGFVAHAEDGRAWTWGMSQDVLERAPAARAAWSLAEGAILDPSGAAVEVDVAAPSALALGMPAVCVIEAGRGIACFPTHWAHEGPRPVERVALERPRALAMWGYDGCVLHGEASITCFSFPRDGSPLRAEPLIWFEPSPRPLEPGPAVEVAAGDGFACARHAHGAVRCWGDDARGQLGDGDPAAARGPVWVFGLDDAIAIAAGYRQACAVRADHTVACWGDGRAGEAGTPARDAFAPRTVEGVEGAIAVAVEYTVGCALLDTGAVRCWGAGAAEWIPGATAHTPPADVPGLDDAVAMALGYHALGVVRREGSLRTYGELAGRAGVRDVATTSARTLHIGNPRHACWGRRDGHAVCEAEVIPADAFAISAFDRCAVRDGRVRCGRWGEPLSDVVGLESVTSIAIEHDVSCATIDDGTVRCSGTIGRGWLADPIDGVEGAARIVALPDGGCAIGIEGARCWGNAVPDANVRAAAEDGTCGIDAEGAVRCAAIEEAVAPATLPRSGAVALDLGGTILEGCALGADGNATCWDARRLRPGPRGVVAIALTEDASDTRHVCAIDGAGSDRAGSDRAGVVSCGASPTRLRPTAVMGAVELALGASHGCARLADGHVACWGDGEGEEPAEVRGLGTRGGEDDRPVRGIDDAIAIAAGGETTCAIRRDRSVWCWGGTDGASVFGDVGLGEVLSPVRIPGIEGAQAISVERDHVCALLEGGRARCWGAVRDDQLGDDSSAFREIALP